MAMGIDQSGHDDFAGGVDNGGSRRDGHLGIFSNGRYQAVLDNQGSGDDFVAVDGYDVRPNESSALSMHNWRATECHHDYGQDIFLQDERLQRIE